MGLLDETMKRLSAILVAAALLVPTVSFAQAAPDTAVQYFLPAVVLLVILFFADRVLLRRFGPGLQSNRLVVAASCILAVSIGPWAWGYNYVSNHQLSAVGNIFGNVDSIYRSAALATNFGVFGFLLGLALLIAGLVRTRPTQ